MRHLQFHYSSRKDWSVKSLRQVDDRDSLQQWSWENEHFLLCDEKHLLLSVCAGSHCAQSVMTEKHKVYLQVVTQHTL